MSSLGIRAVVTGNPPSRGLVVSNHISYLDIAIYAATMPCSMVAKAEVSAWPLFGMMARASGALFVDRGSRSSALAVTEQVAERLRGPSSCVVLSRRGLAPMAAKCSAFTQGSSRPRLKLERR